jgi:hypothetical protein
VEQIGGPPVKPYQPAGLWEEKSGLKYERDAGAGSHRRSLYSHWKRTSPPPSMMTFDTSTREVCVVRRQTTATPLQVLVLLNDPQYVEAARAAAETVMRQVNRTDAEAPLVRLFRTFTGRWPTAEESKVLGALYREQHEDFRTRPDDVEQLLEVGDHARDPRLDAVDLAALTVVAQTLLNYDEAVTKR